MKQKLFAFFVALAMLGICSCEDWESYGTDPSARLTFSEDTIAFDTLISTLPSATKTLYVFNNNDNGIRISSIYLDQSDRSFFRVNVDGRYLVNGHWNDFQILKHDSLVIRIEMTPPVSGSAEPISFSDLLYFKLENGAVQSVKLKGGSQDAHLEKDGLIIEEDKSLLTDLPYVIYDSLVVKEGATLTLKAGTKLMFHEKAALHVYGKLLIEGTVEQPVVLRGDRMDHMFDYLPYDNTPGRWEGVIIHRGSYGNILYQCDLHSSCFGIICEDNELKNPDPEKLSLTLDGCILNNIAGDGLQFNNCCSKVVNTQISNTGGHCVNIISGSHDFLYCTLAQFYIFKSDRGMALNLVSCEEDEHVAPLQHAYFINCVITGYGDDVVQGENIYTDNNVCDFLFHHCYLNTTGMEDEHFIDNVYDDKNQPLKHNENFMLFDTDNYLYDFTPKAESGIRSIADRFYVGLPETDRMGNRRDADEGADAGCYEYQTPKETAKDEMRTYSGR